MASQQGEPGDSDAPPLDGPRAGESVNSSLHADASVLSAAQHEAPKVGGSTLEGHHLPTDDAGVSRNENQPGKKKKKGKHNRRITRYKKPKKKWSDDESDAEQPPSSIGGSSLNPQAQTFNPTAQKEQILSTGSILTPDNTSGAASSGHIASPAPFSQHATMVNENHDPGADQAEPMSSTEPTINYENAQCDSYGLAGQANITDDGHLADDEAPRAVRPLPEAPLQPQPTSKEDSSSRFTQGAYHSFQRRQSQPSSFSLRAPTILSAITEQSSESSEEERRKSNKRKGKERQIGYGDCAVSTTEPEESQDTCDSITSELFQSESPKISLAAKKRKQRFSRLTAAMLDSTANVSSSSSGVKRQGVSSVMESKIGDDSEGWCLVAGRRKTTRSSIILMSRGRPLARRSADETEWARLSTTISKNRGGRTSVPTPRPPAMNETEYPPLPSPQRATTETSSSLGEPGPSLEEIAVQAAKIGVKVAQPMMETSTPASEAEDPMSSMKQGHRRQLSIRLAESPKKLFDQAETTVTAKPTEQKSDECQKTSESQNKVRVTAISSDESQTASATATGSSSAAQPPTDSGSSSSTDTWRPFIVSSVLPQTRGSSSSELSNAANSQTPHAANATVDTPRSLDVWYWQLDTHAFPCARRGCINKCLTWGATTVICPRCGPYSEIRYCNLTHLFEDIKNHWFNCGQYTFEHPCVGRLPREWEDGPPMLPCIHGWDTPERHRQAVRFNMDRSGDYFIFRDWWDWVEAKMPENDVRVRCSRKVATVVKFEGEMRDRFRRCLALALFAGLEVFHVVQYIFRMIRDHLRARNEWTNNLDYALRYQLRLETGVHIRAIDVGRRHACETEWIGTHRLRCTDRVCCDEYTTLPVRMRTLHSSYGIERLVSYAEANFWILRASRISHPDVSDVNERIRGKGFSGVREEHRRLFGRGAGWDGAGTGEMEIEPI